MKKRENSQRGMYRSLEGVHIKTWAYLEFLGEIFWQKAKCCSNEPLEYLERLWKVLILRKLTKKGKGIAQVKKIKFILGVVNYPK